VTDASTSSFEALLESAPDSIVLVDSGGLITLVNRRTEELFGYTRADLLGEPVEVLVPERFRGMHLDHRSGYLSDPRTREMGAELELYGRRKDGSEFPVEISLSPLHDGSETSVITIVRDVSDRRAAEARFRILLESAPDAIVLVDSDGRITLVNRRAEELFGYAPEELLGRNVEMLVPERLRSSHVLHRSGYVDDPRTREMGAGLDLYGLRKDTSEFPVEISLSPMTTATEELVITIVRDVSERRAAELERIELAREQAAHAEAEAGRERLASILGEIDAIVWEADSDRTRFTFVSQRAEEALGYELSDWLEDGFWKRIVHPDDVELTDLYFREAVARGEDHEYEYRVRRADGRTAWIRDRVRAVPSGVGGVQLRGVTVDVTARRELEERLLQSQKMEAVGQLAGGIAHDFNNLLVVISGYTQLLRGRIDDGASLGHLEQIGKAADRAAALTAQLLAFGRRAPTATEDFDAAVLVDELEPMLRRLIDADVRLTLGTSRHEEWVRADPRQIEQVLVNLVINARDAMPLGGEITIETSSVDIDSTEAAELGLRPGRHVVIKVSDNGSGMTEQTKARLFEPFFTTKEQGKGTGLGLATAYGIVEQANGKITVESELGVGTMFVIYLPESGALPDETAPDGTKAESGPAILVVEDDSAVRELVQTVLEEHGYRVSAAGNGREALEHLGRRANQFDLVLSDVVMPDINGPELAARVRALAPELRVLFMSGYADSQLLSRGVSEKALKILHKPFTPEELAGRVTELLKADGEGPR
jgi:PAS domain S-box-containing protein